MSSFQSRVVAAVIASLSCTTVFAADPIQQWVQKFQNASPEQTKQIMDQTAKKRIKVRILKAGEKCQAGEQCAPFTQEQIKQRLFAKKKNDARQKKFPKAQVQNGRAGIEENDMARELVDLGGTEKFITDINTLTEEKYQKAELKTQPWSDTYWPIYQGVLAARYADPSFPTDDFKSASKYGRDALAKILRGDYNFLVSSIDKLSVAEKYDLLIGNEKNFKFAKANWDDGDANKNEKGEVETWMGICHGWSPAAYMLPRPTKTITLTAADGKTKIPFYPSDIKGLGSLLWAKNNYETKFIGGRCNSKDPKTEPSTGRILEQDCFDNNPGSVFLAVINQIAIAKRSMVLDATFDYEVWNQPIQSYEYKLFNPQTGKTVKSLKDAKVKKSDFTKDKFKSHRDSSTVAMVGIAMDLTYVVETDPSHTKTDSKDKDALNTASYMFDIELNARDEIIGGEWYQNTHPDFLWTPTKNAKINTGYERGLVASEWKAGENEVLPSSWQKAAQDAASNQNVLTNIVNAIFKKAAKAERAPRGE